MNHFLIAGALSALLGFSQVTTDCLSPVADSPDTQVVQLQRELMTGMQELNQAVDAKNAAEVERLDGVLRQTVAQILVLQPDDILVEHLQQGAEYALDCAGKAAARVEATGDDAFGAGFDYGFNFASYNTWSGL